MSKRGWNLKDPAVIAARKAAQAAFYADEEKSKANSEVISKQKKELFADEEKSAPTRKKMSDKATERALRTPEEERKTHMRKLCRKAWDDPESNAKLMEARQRPRTFTPEQRQKRRINAMGNTANLGKKFTPEHCRKIGIGQLDVKRPFIDTAPERVVSEYLSSRGIIFSHPYHLKGIVKQFDFYIPALKLLIETDGCWHHACPIHCPLKAEGEKEWRVKKVAADRHSEERLELLYPEFTLVRIWSHDLVGKGAKDIAVILKLEETNMDYKGKMEVIEQDWEHIVFNLEGKTFVADDSFRQAFNTLEGLVGKKITLSTPQYAEADPLVNNKNHLWIEGMKKLGPLHYFLELGSWTTTL